VRILCIDDEPLITKVVSRIMDDHEVVEFTDACAAIRHLVGGDPPPDYDVIMCDLLMPECSGMDVHREVAALRPDLAGRIVFATGATLIPRAMEFLASVRNASIEKPFRIDRLRAVLLEVGSRRS